MVWLVVVSAVAVTIVLAIWARRHHRVLDEVARRMDDLGEGRSVRPLLARVGGPVGRLARVFNTTAPRL